ncbi:hypothetical protein Hanom_Chr10g00888401 [Helianthus anomalus]
MVILSTAPITQPPLTPQRFPTHSPSPPKRPPSPKVKFTRKRKTFIVKEDDEEIKSPIPLSSVPIQTTPLSSFPLKSTAPLPPGTQPSIIPLATQYPLEVHTIKGEIESFFTIEDVPQRSFPYLYGYRMHSNLDEYLKLKAKQAEYIAKENNKGMDDRKF